MATLAAKNNALLEQLTHQLEARFAEVSASLNRFLETELVKREDLCTRIRAGEPLAPTREAAMRAVAAGVSGMEKVTAVGAAERRWPTDASYAAAHSKWTAEANAKSAPKSVAKPSPSTQLAAKPTALAAASVLPAIATVTGHESAAALCKAGGAPFLKKFEELIKGMGKIPHSSQQEIAFTHGGRNITVVFEKVHPFPSAKSANKIRIAAVSAEKELAENRVYLAHLAAVRKAVSSRDFPQADKDIVELGAAEGF